MMRCRFLALLCWFALSAAGQASRPIKLPLSPDLLQKLAALAPGDSVSVAVSVKSFSGLSTTDFRLQKAWPSAPFYKTKLSKAELLLLASQSAVIFINEQHIPKEELNTGAVDYTLNKINFAHRLYPSVGGDSVAVIIKERSFDTTDIDLKGRVFSTPLQASLSTPHAAQMVTIVAGAGNSSPFALGAAPAATVGSVDFANLFPEGDAFYAQKKIRVQNHSYGTVVENFYGAEAAAYDASAAGNPALLHVFSAGNAGTTAPASGTYNGLLAANLTGNFKQSKNTLSVAALDSAGSPMAAASRGPAFDGRLKPELSAYGEDGSSGAAALVSGAAALVQDAVRKKTGALPSSDLVKAILLNSADEAGTPGIDYNTGYGSLNAQKAIATVLENRVLQGSVSQGAVQTFSLPVPANVSKLKITLVWKDAPAIAGASKALVNDLDLTLRLASASQSWLPWVLNPSPGLSLLQAPAQRKVDTLNVVEQITVDNPAAGAYSIDVKGTGLSTALQRFSIAYQIDTASQLSWTFPTGNDPLIAGRTQWIRWQTTFSGAAQIDYATSANNWRTLATLADVSQPYFKWILPDTTATAVLRMRHLSSGAVILSDTFVVSPLLNMQTGFNCADSFLLNWNALPSARYRVFELSGPYLSPFAQLPDTSVLLRKAQHSSAYYAVSPLVNGREGLRSQTLNYVSAGVGCYIKAFYLQTQTASVAFFTAEIGSLYHVQQVSLEKATASGFVAVQTFPSPTTLLFSLADSSLTPVENRYRFAVKLTNGITVYSNVETVYFLSLTPVVLYPNPVPQGGSVSIQAKEAGRYGLQVFDAIGKLVYTQTLNSSSTRFEAARFPKGVYVLRITDAQGKAFAQKLAVY